jgi:tungstate transport system permease protein
LHDITHGFEHARRLLITNEQDVWGIILRSLLVSGLSPDFGCIIGIPIGAIIGLRRFRGKRAAVAAVNVGMSPPPVVVGLLVYLPLSYSGPLGFMRLRFRVPAMVIAQTILAAPMIGALTLAAVEPVDRRAREALERVGASGLIGEPAWLLSGSEAQLVSIARAGCGARDPAARRADGESRSVQRRAGGGVDRRVGDRGHGHAGCAQPVPGAAVGAARGVSVRR